MEKLFKRLQNIGIRSNTDPDCAKRIRLGNTMPMMGMVSGSVVLLVIYFAGGPTNAVLFTVFVVVTLFIPLLLNYFGKNVSSRVFYILLSFLYIAMFAIVFGAQSHFQYYLLTFLGIPLIFFGDEIGKAKFVLSSLGLLIYFYLEWHFVTLRELEMKNKGLKHFANIASHDLSEPLRTVDSFVEMIHDEYADTSDENISTYFSFIHDALHRMRNMIDGLLQYSKIGKSGNFERINLNQLVQEIELDLKELILEKKAVIQKSDLPTIVCLPLEMRQLFQNLISNAIKFQAPETDSIIKILKNIKIFLKCLLNYIYLQNIKDKESV